MSIPFFYIESFDAGTRSMILDEETSRHVVQVLRMNDGEKLNLTDGKGNLIAAEITDAHKKHCSVKIIDLGFSEGVLSDKTHDSRKIIIAISLLKNTNRFEWFLEKATEIGISEIIPLICERTEKQKFRYDRMKGICISAMLQSQQTWLPVLHEPLKFADLQISRFADHEKLIAHCEEGKKHSLKDLQIRTSAHSLICIGPEGDFTKEEIEQAIKNNFIPVSLGETRLRTETAGIVAATLLCHI